MPGAEAINGHWEPRRDDSSARTGRNSDRNGSFLSSKPLPGTALCMALVGLAIVLGGGGTANPQTEMLLQLLIALAMIPLVASSQWQRGLCSIPRTAWLLGGLVLIMPALQLIPLPPAIWRGLPGRTIEVEALSLVQADQAWMPLTMAPARTFASLLAMICPVLMLLQVSRLTVTGRSWICATIVVSGALSLALGLMQLSRTGGMDWSLYSEFSVGYLDGFQANHNAQADILLITILAMGVLVGGGLRNGKRHTMARAVLLLSLPALILGVVMTGSRAGIVLLLPTLIFLGIMLWPKSRARRGLLVWSGGAAFLLLLSGIILLQFPAVQKIASRFALAKDARTDLWADTWFAIGQVWPYGSGIGTIVPMLEAAERLDVVDQTRPVRAHNDWLEWILEAGLPGIIVLAMILLVVGIALTRAWLEISRKEASSGRRDQVVFACGVFAVEALHAFVDYPMRSMSLATLAAVAFAFLLKPAAVQHPHP